MQSSRPRPTRAQRQYNTNSDNWQIADQKLELKPNTDQYFHCKPRRWGFAVYTIFCWLLTFSGYFTNTRGNGGEAAAIRKRNASSRMQCSQHRSPVRELAYGCPTFLPVSRLLVTANTVKQTHSSFGFMAGNRRTSLIEKLSVRIIVKRSIPRPHPAVGGRPYSRATQKSSS
jgi:hypothetical protein